MLLLSNRGLDWEGEKPAIVHITSNRFQPVSPLPKAAKVTQPRGLLLPILKSIPVLEIASIEKPYVAYFTWLKPTGGKKKPKRKKVETGLKCVCTEPWGVPGVFSPRG